MPRVLAVASLLVFAVPLAAAGDVQCGIDVLVADSFKELAGKHVGLITNPTGLTRDLLSTVDVLHEAPQVELVALFGPEHGVRGDAYAGDSVDDSRDAKTGLPVYSLYGKSRTPKKDMLAGIDTLVFDIQDIGSRSYTYITTMSSAMATAAEYNLAFVVLDRPNPLTGNRIEGRPLDPAYKSGVGCQPIPYVHGLTVGELARMINGEGWLPEGAKCSLTVVPMKGWQRDMLFDDTGLTWVPTSPHVPRSDSALFYAATGILGELHVLSEGVGYTLPFELIGGPDIDADRFAAAMEARKLPGVRFRPIHFKPYYGPNEGKACGGVQIHFTDRRKAYLTAIQFHAMDVASRTFGTTLFGNDRDNMFDKVCGTDGMRKLMQEGASIEKVLAFWNEGVEAFRAQRAKYLLYK